MLHPMYANSATDNPLIDSDNKQDFHGGNFLGQYVGIAMDQLRYYLGRKVDISGCRKKRSNNATFF